MRVVVNRMQCESFGVCVDVAPEVFHLGDDDVLVVHDGEIPPDRLRQVEEAVRLCPKRALSIEKPSIPPAGATKVRIRPLVPSEYTAEVHDAIESARPPADTPRPRGLPRGLNALGTFARYPELAKAFMIFNRHVLYASSLSDRQRELLVLRVAMRRHSEYEWLQHAVIGEAAGLTKDEIKRILSPSDSLGWDPLDSALLAAADELVADAEISSATWNALTQHFDDRQMMDLVFTVGTYEVLAMAFRSFGIELDADLEPYRATVPMWTNQGTSDE